MASEYIDATTGEVVPLGLVEGLSNEAYHAAPGYSSSVVKASMEQSLLHYWHRYERPDREPEEPSEDLIFGTAVHAALLEPDVFERTYRKSLQFDRRTKIGKEGFAAFQAECAEKKQIALPPDSYDACQRIRDRILRHPVAAGMFTGGRAEQSFFAIDQTTGELRKCRPDYLSGWCIDLKTTKDASKKAFGRDIGNFGYDLSAAWYLDVLNDVYGEEPEHFVWVAAEKEPPYAIGIYFAERHQIERARECIRRGFKRLVEAKRNNHWPDYGESAEPADIPPWIER
jgi:exodeoxyribonuclease VIII